MEMISVDSSNLDSVGYDDDSGILVIEFKKGAAYEYYDVPRYVFDELLGAESKGKYANHNIYKIYNQQRIR
ncbi:MAG: KTSC domain-containing protein [bacterium]